MKNAIIFFILITLLSCKKDSLTPETQKGANTFSCKINGKVFKPCNSGLFGATPLFGGYSSNYSILRINATCTASDPYKSVSIELSNFQGVGEYLLKDSNNVCIYRTWDPVFTYSSELTNNGKVIIKKDDRVNGIVSGTFEFTGQNLNSSTNDMITITSGRFDIKL